MVELMSVPKEVVYDFDRQYLAEQIMDEFFLNTQEYILNLCPDFSPSNLEVKFRDITSSGKITKDKLIYLVFNREREHVVANVLCTQIESNNFCYTFFRDLNFLSDSERGRL
jgi:hypothetical protein